MDDPRIGVVAALAILWIHRYTRVTQDFEDRARSGNAHVALVVRSPTSMQSRRAIQELRAVTTRLDGGYCCRLVDTQLPGEHPIRLDGHLPECLHHTRVVDCWAVHLPGDVHTE